MAFNLEISDPLGFIAILKRDTKLFQWLSLVFQMVLSSTVSFCFACGTSLELSRSWPISIGAGMLSVAAVLAIFFTTSPLTKGMMLVRPTAAATAELETDIAITRK
jgi:hypothetical protein